jgi:hypothetical protein
MGLRVLSKLLARADAVKDNVFEHDGQWWIESWDGERGPYPSEEFARNRLKKHDDLSREAAHDYWLYCYDPDFEKKIDTTTEEKTVARWVVPNDPYATKEKPTCEAIPKRGQLAPDSGNPSRGSGARDDHAIQELGGNEPRAGLGHPNCFPMSGREAITEGTQREVPRVLLIECDPRIEKAAQQLLSSTTYRVRSTDFADAVEVAGGFRPHVTVLGMFLPDTERIELGLALSEVTLALHRRSITFRSRHKLSGGGTESVHIGQAIASKLALVLSKLQPQ